MNTKTMRLPPRRVLTPTNKRKERDDPFDRPKPIPAPPTTKILKPDRPVDPITATSKAVFVEPKPSNQLLAGYLAHEFLTKGTLLGQPWAPPKGKSTEDGGEEAEPTAAPPPYQRTEQERERSETACVILATRSSSLSDQFFHLMLSPIMLSLNANFYKLIGVERWICDVERWRPL
ncbi:uncharacterized protein LOC114192507 isoform X3 [Vigna unguiculata]|uniref:uncharacterized protein LOC114192507 isoform X3 n=1 Tax=Vigna unguiculata TaxID=3917 RepID=UPI0010166BD1|nr:uncharacterized protein LOC114192507 isoform X3 [Vigna unguiculata]